MKPIAAALALVAALLLPSHACAFDFADVDKRAAELAKRSYEVPKNDLPSTLKNLTYNQYRDIRFRKPGTDTVVSVKARLHARRNIAKLGIAPLTSMYLYGENQRAAGEDYRPEVHDSDGLSVQLGTGEWVWRPLVNPKRLLVTSFGATNPRAAPEAQAASWSTGLATPSPAMPYSAKSMRS